MVDVSDESIELPPGFRFHPTDEEIITHYLSEKFLNSSFTARAIGEADLNKCEPWDLPRRAKMGEKEFYFFCQRDRKYPTGMRTNRATEAGYWKATGKDKEIYKGRNNLLIGMKKTLVFYRGRAPKGDKTNWVMHEYRLEGKFAFRNLPKISKDEWVVCRVFHKNTGVKKIPVMTTGLLRMDSFEDQFLDAPSLPPLYDPSSSVENNTNGNSFNGTSTENQFFYSEDAKNYVVSNNNTLFPNTNYFSAPHLTAYQGSSQSAYLQPDMVGISSPDPLAMFRGLGADNAVYYDSKRQCKVEQFSCNQSMVSLSQDTGLSNDMNNEISSMASKHEMGSDTVYQDFEGPSSSTAGLVELDCLWNY